MGNWPGGISAGGRNSAAEAYIVARDGSMAETSRRGDLGPDHMGITSAIFWPTY
jgi:hypothetical protein